MKTPTAISSKQSGTDAYLSLICRFPLRPIRNDREHGRATEIIGELIGRKTDRGTGDYLDTLILLVNKYEDEQHTVSNELTPQQAVRAIMAVNGMTQKQMGQLIGSESALSMFLKGDRQLSKSHIKALAERFRIAPLVFF